MANTKIKDEKEVKTSTVKARDAKEYDMLLIDYIESEIKGESK